MRHYICITCLLLVSLTTLGQPGTEIYLFDMKVKKGKVFITNPTNITHRVGYDNQPFFHPDQPLLYYVSADTTGRTDIMEYDYREQITSRITRTLEREYSPTVTPDRRFISCIVQRDNGVQDVCKYPVEGGAATVVINSLKVGYHAWSDDHLLAVFVLGDSVRPNSLHGYFPDVQRDTVLAQNIGRSLHRVPKGRSISFVHKEAPNRWFIKHFTPGHGIDVYGETPAGREDMAWTPAGGILISDGKQILYHAPGTPWGWQTVDIQFTGDLQTISRLAVSARGDKIAVVMNE